MTSDKLYGLAFEYKKTKLWNHLSDTQVFALELSGGRVGYISIMGRAGGHCALGLFIGDEGFNSFRVIAQADPIMMSQLEFHEHLIQQTCLQCIFEGKDGLTKEEREDARRYARSHGIRISGRNAYPHFMKYQPNYFPWQLQTEQEMDDLSEALSAALQVAELLEAQTPEELGLEVMYDDMEGMMMLKRQGQAWELGRTPLPPEPPKVYPSPKPSNDIAVASLKKMKKTGIWECEIIRFPQPVQNDPGEPPVFPALLIAVDSSTGYMLQVSPVENYEKNPEELLNLFMDALLQEKIRPIKIKARDERTYAFAAGLCEKLKVAVSIEDDLPALDEAEDSFMERFGGGGEEADFDELNRMLDEVLMLGEPQLDSMPPEMTEFFRMLKEEITLPADIQEKLDIIFRLEDDNVPKKTSPRGRRKKRNTPPQSCVVSVSLGAGCYRHIQISMGASLFELHSAILKAFGFYDDHAHAFFMNNSVWSNFDSYYMAGMGYGDRTTDKYSLEQAGFEKDKKFKYVYDFGAEWRFQCRVLRVQEGDTPKAVVIKSKGEAPDQDGDW